MKWTKTSFVLLVFFIAAWFSLRGQTTICWDNSLSMAERNLDRDFSVLNRIFEKDPNQEVQLLLFNVEITEKTYRIVDGNWEQLKNDLSNQAYDGGNIYAHLKDKIRHENVFVFTDGNSILKQDTLHLKPLSFIVNSCEKRNIDFLNRTVLLTKSRLMDFASMLPKNQVKSESLSKEETVTGTVYIDNQPAPNVMIAVQSERVVTSTDSNGNFTIMAQVGDSILVSSTDNKTYKRLKISSKESTKVFLEPNLFSLEEVVVVEERAKKLATTGLGKVDKDRLGYDIKSIGDDDITTINTTLSSAIQGKFAGVRYGQNDDLSQAVIRGGGNSLLSNNYGLLVVDGVPLRQSNSFTGDVVDTSFLDPENIAEVTVLKGLAATNRFGSLGANGVLLITTKTALPGSVTKQNSNSARVQNNIFDGKLNILGKANISYIEELASLPNHKDAYQLYLQQRYSYDNPYYLDVYDFFKPRNAKSAIRVASNILEHEKATYEEVRALFLKASKHKDHKLQYLVATKLMEDYSEKTQTYYDMALAQINSGEYQFAMDMFLSILDGSANENLKFDGLQKRVRSELKDLINNHEENLNLQQVPASYLNSVKYEARLVFDWNDENAEFDIQFVNPQNRFFEWEHTNFGNQQRIEDELRNGYSSEEFILTGDGIEGKWIVNISYKGKRSNQENDLPTFIKCRLDYNFGSPNYHFEERELRLTQTSDRQFFFDFKI